MSSIGNWLHHFVQLTQQTARIILATDFGDAVDMTQRALIGESVNKTARVDDSPPRHCPEPAEG